MVTLAHSAVRAIVISIASVSALVLSAPPALADRNRTDQWYLGSLKVTAAQRLTRGEGITIAVIDSGVWAGHPDFKDAILPGRNLLYNSDGRADISGHGTAMAGIIAARGRRKEDGLLGIAPAAKILPVTPYNDTQLLVDAINWSVGHGADVINMSFGVSDEVAVHNALKAAVASNVVLIAAVGNAGDKGNLERFPAAYPEVLAVGAIDRIGNVPAFSEHGRQVDLVAPGVEVPTLDKSSVGGYSTSSGTSASAAIVSGAAALVRARYPELSAAEVVQRLTATAKDKGPKGRDDAYGYGELDLMAALTAKAPSHTPTPPPPTADAPVASSPESDDRSGVPPLVFVVAGVVLVLGAAVIAARFLRKRA